MAQTGCMSVFFSGNVQGVGFRFTTLNLSRRFAVNGFVRNLPDGRVELQAEGAREELAAFLEAIVRTMRGHIEDSEVATGTCEARFRGFDIW
jgi:acylphosphatase